MVAPGLQVAKFRRHPTPTQKTYSIHGQALRVQCKVVVMASAWLAVPIHRLQQWALFCEVPLWELFVMSMHQIMVLNVEMMTGAPVFEAQLALAASGLKCWYPNLSKYLLP